jgi:hypothetical protein
LAVSYRIFPKTANQLPIVYRVTGFALKQSKITYCLPSYWICSKKEQTITYPPATYWTLHFTFQLPKTLKTEFLIRIHLSTQLPYTIHKIHLPLTDSCPYGGATAFTAPAKAHNKMPTTKATIFLLLFA